MRRHSDITDPVDQVMKQQGRSRSEFLREAVLRYIEEWEWRRLLQYGEERAWAQGIVPGDVAGLIEEYRAQVGHSQTSGWSWTPT